MTPDLINLLKRKNRLYKKCMKLGKETEKYKRYALCTNDYNRQIKNAKNNYYQNLFYEFRNDSKKHGI